MSSTGKGRLYRMRHYTGLRGKLGLPDVDAAARKIANDTFWGGYAPTPTQIPYDWLTPPARFRSDPPRNVALISRAGGSTARKANAASVAAVGERPFTATLASQVIADPAAYANWIVGNYTTPRRRMPQLRINLLGRTPTELWRILGRKIGDRISITDAPGVLATIRDTWTRIVTSAWDNTDTGEPWTVDAAPAADYDANGAQGVMTMSVVNSERRMVVDLAHATIQQVTVWNQLPVVPTGAPINWGALLRHQDSSNYYWVDVQVGTDSSLTLRLVTRVNGTLAQVATVATGVVHSTTVPRVLVAQVSGSRIRARLYASDGTDPRDWQLDTTDTSLTTGTNVGVIGRLMAGSLNVGNTLRFDNFTAAALSPTAWPDGVTELVIEGITHSISGDERYVVWNTAPLIGDIPGDAGPWFRADESLTDIGDPLAF